MGTSCGDREPFKGGQSRLPTSHDLKQTEDAHQLVRQSITSSATSSSNGEAIITRNVPNRLNWLQGEERERVRNQAPPPPPERLTIHYTELPEDASGGRIAAEWNLYRREVGRLLAEGHEGKWILIKGEDVIGIWDTEEQADVVRLQRFPMQDVLLKQILVREPVVRGGGYDHRWPI